jgi:FkbM family methyltransferase
MTLRILVLSQLHPRPDFHSGDRRLAALLEQMARSHRVDFVALVHEDPDQVAAGREVLTRIGVRPLGVGPLGVQHALAGCAYHVIFCEFYRVFSYQTVPTLRARQPGAVIVVDSVDVHFAREEAAARLGLLSPERAAATRRDELAAYRAADAVIVVTPEDAEVLRQEGGTPPLWIVPNAVSIRVRRERARNPQVLFIGGFRHPPNVDAVTWLVRDIWPRVRRAVPAATLNIVGSNPTAEVTALGGTAGVCMIGYVPDTAPFLDEAAVSVAPLRYGAGMKGKVNEAMAFGVPVVATTFGVQGLPVVNGTHAVVADRADDFADAVIRLLMDPIAASEVGGAGQELAKNYSPEAASALLNRMLNQLVPRPKSPGRYVRWQLAKTRFRLRQVAQLEAYVPEMMKELPRKALGPLVRPLGFLHWTIASRKVPAESPLTQCFQLLRRLGCQPNHIVDVGAHHGNWTRQALRYFPDAYYTLVEPHTWMRADVEDLLTTNPKVQWHNVAAGKSEGVLALTLPADSSSFYVSSKEENLFGRPQLEVPVVTLDGLLRKSGLPAPEIIRIDGERLDLSLLEGAASCLETTNVFFVEAPVMNNDHNDISSVLRAMTHNGYRLFDITDLNRVGEDDSLRHIGMSFVKAGGYLDQAISSNLTEGRNFRDFYVTLPMNAPLVKDRESQRV